MCRISFRIRCGLVGAAALFLLVCCLSALAGPGDRTYVAGNSIMTIGGASCGFLKSVEGGAISAEVINEPAGPDYFVKKHIGQPRYEDVTIHAGFSMGRVFYDWIRDSWSMSYNRKDCRITALNYQFEAKENREYNECLITSTTIPACDGSSKEPGYLSVTFTPEYSRISTGDGSKQNADYKIEQKKWLPCNFALRIDGLNCSRVSKIDSFTVKQTAVTDDIGDARDQAKEPGKLEFPNLRITFAEADLAGWSAWHKQFVIDGNNDEGYEKKGSLTFLSPNRDKALLTIEFHNLGIFRLEPEKAESNADQIKRWTAELYCERMTFNYDEGEPGGSSGPGASTPATSTASTTTTPAAPAGVTVDTSSATTSDTQTSDASLFGTRRFGNPPFEFSIKGLEYTVTRQYVGGLPIEPDAKSKLMLIRYTIHNPSDRSMNVFPAMLKFQITDSAGANHEIQGIGVGAKNQSLGGSITPGQTIACCAIARVPGDVDAEGLMVACSGDVEKYKAAGEAQIREQFARDAEAGPAAAYTALAEVPIGAGVFYPLMSLDYRLDEIGFAERPKVESRPRENTRCLVAAFTLKNPSPKEISWGTGSFSAAIRMSDGSTLPWQGYPLSSLEDRPIPIALTPGQEMKLRVFFDVPISETVTPASFRFAQLYSRVYYAELQQVRQPVRRSG